MNITYLVLSLIIILIFVSWVSLYVRLSLLSAKMDHLNSLLQLKDIKLNEGNYICVVNPDGMNQVLNNLGKENCITIYVERDDRERVCSTLMRDKSSDFGKVLEEATRRYKADEIDFAKMKYICDYIVVNEVLDNAVNRVLDIIECNL